MTYLERARDAIYESLEKGEVTQEMMEYGVMKAIQEAVDFKLGFVRCENCKNWHRGWASEREYGFCYRVDMSVKKDFYCGEGRKKE